MTTIIDLWFLWLVLAALFTVVANVLYLIGVDRVSRNFFVAGVVFSVATGFLSILFCIGALGQIVRFVIGAL